MQVCLNKLSLVAIESGGIMNDIYNDISRRTNGEILIGVVGPVRSGKSTFITKFMEELVIPNIVGKSRKK